MQRCLIVFWIVGVFVIGTAYGSRVDGYAYREGECIHSCISVRCLTCDFSQPTKHTDESGYFGPWSAISGGREHCFEYLHLGFCIDTLCCYIPPLGDTTLPSVTLERGLCGPLSGTLGPGDWPVLSDIWVKSGERLDIEAGARLLFTGDYELNVYGLLTAYGVPGDLVVFTRRYPTQQSEWGGIRLHSDDLCFLEHCLIEYVNANGYGIYCDNGNPSIVKCTIVNNSGGGIYFAGGAHVCVPWCTISRNGGFGIECPYQENPWWDLRAENTIIWGNGGGSVHCPPEAFSATYCDIEGGYPDEGNIDCDPLFNDPETGNWHLSWENYPIEDETKSCCIDSGDPGLLDADGTRKDIGSHPFFQSPEGFCLYKYRCDNDMTIAWCEGFYPNWSDLSTAGIYDGESAGDVNWFIMDIRGIVHQTTPVHVTDSNFGSLVSYDIHTLDTVQTIRIRDSYKDQRGLAYDDRDGSFWYTTKDESYLYHIDGHGDLIRSYSIPWNHITGLAFDADNNHLWAIINGSPDLFVEFDVSDLDAVISIQGHFPVPWSLPSDHNSAAGLDYDEYFNVLIAVNQKNSSVEFFRDLHPSSDGGVKWNNSCFLFEQPLTPQPTPSSIALNHSTGDLWVAGNTSGGPFPLDIYKEPEVVCSFIRGDYICDGQVLTNDPLMELGWIFGSVDAPPSCMDAADYNDDGAILTNDPLMALQHIFGVPGSTEPPPPYPDCGPDPTTEDNLNCIYHEFCMDCRALAYKPSVSVRGAENRLVAGEITLVDGVVRVPVDLTVTEAVCGFDISLGYDVSCLRFVEVVGGDGYDFYAVDTRQEGVVRIGVVPDIEMAELMGAGTHRVAEILFSVENLEIDGKLNWRNVEVYGANVEPLPVEWIGGLVKAGVDLPTEFALRQNYPNPFNPTTLIKYDLPVDCQVRLDVYNLLGEKAATLVHGRQKAGYKSARWNASSFSSGVYFYRMQAGVFTKTRKMILLR